MSGDIPCNRPCRNRMCPWCAFGHCMDNDTCEERVRGEADYENTKE